MSVFVTGGAGYIGSHTCVELLKAGYEIVVADSLVNSCEEALRRVERITGKHVSLIQADLCDPIGAHESGPIGEDPNGYRSTCPGE